jgi:DNA-binding MarR family transcriptional regulator
MVRYAKLPDTRRISMTSKQAKEKIAQACEDAIAEVGSGRWKGVDALLRGAADVARSMTSTAVPIMPLPPARGKTKMDLATEPRYSQSLERGLHILALFTGERMVWGIADIADELGMSRSTTHRYAISLVKMGQIEPTDHRKYRRVLPA